jgi:hypothetical protein
MAPESRTRGERQLATSDTDRPLVAADSDADARAVEAGHILAPAAAGVVVERHAELVFWDAGGNFERVVCSGCRREVPVDWWQERMSAAWDSGWRSLEVTVPCCRVSTTLNDLVYEWPQGFARWVLEIKNPGRQLLTVEELDGLAGTVGHPLREIWTHM